MRLNWFSMNGINMAHARAYNRVNISISFAGLAKEWEPILRPR
jgi:hypothetical protein